jgi:ribosomal protein S18 acetylase RimI-like enzyme
MQFVGLAGHIEDIVTHSDYRGQNLGRNIIDALKFIADNRKCYKSKQILLMEQSFWIATRKMLDFMKRLDSK